MTKGNAKAEPPPHDAHVEVGMSGVIVTCACGDWVSDTGKLAASTETRKSAMDRWYAHYLQAQRAAQ